MVQKQEEERMIGAKFSTTPRLKSPKYKIWRVNQMREVDLVITDLNQIIEDEVYALPPDQIAAVAEFLADKLNEIREFSYE
jgi:hypothetical protein